MCAKFDFKSIIFKLIIQNSISGTCCEIALRQIPQYLTNEKSTVVQVMAWYCHDRQQAISWANADPDLCNYMMSLEHNVLTHDQDTTKSPMKN